MVHLTHNQGFRWYSLNNVHCKGCFFDNNDQLYEGVNMPQFFKDVFSFNDFVERLKKCNGIFSVIINHQDSYWLAVDRNISFPLFYSKVEGIYFVSDDPENLISRRTVNRIDPFQQTLFKAFGHTFGNKTLINDIYQVGCAEAICLDSNELKQIHFHSFSVQRFQDLGYEKLKEAGKNIFDQALSRLVNSLNGRTAVVPLSGGYDSRFIAAGLKRMGYTNVVCYTYGKRENNPEWRISKKVAGTLGFKWIFVEYSTEFIQKYICSKEFEPYIHFVGHYSSLFFLQEYFAVRYLNENNLVPEDAVFLPGHSGDLIGGSQLVKVFEKELSFHDLSEHFIAQKSYYSTLKKTEKKQLKNELDLWWAGKRDYYAASVFEEIDIQEKISKVIFNSALIFDFFGYEKRFPYWDVPLLDFFLSVPMEHRELKKLYDDIFITHFFEPLGIHFKTELQPTSFELKKQHLKNYIKGWVPKKMLKNVLLKNDWLNYHQATQLLIQEMNQEKYLVNQNIKSFNEILIAYYLFKISKNGLTTEK
jgi:asparagine synthase (glutamine-hydrolysing)